MHIKLNKTPFARTNPKSRPIVKLINTNAKSPTIVVTELLDMAVNALYNALFIAFTLSGSFCFSCLYLSINIIE